MEGESGWSTYLKWCFLNLVVVSSVSELIFSLEKVVFNVVQRGRANQSTVIIPKEDFEACSPYWIPRAKRSLVILSWHCSLAFSQRRTLVTSLRDRFWVVRDQPKRARKAQAGLAGAGQDDNCKTRECVPRTQPTDTPGDKAKTPEAPGMWSQVAGEKVAPKQTAAAEAKDSTQAQTSSTRMAGKTGNWVGEEKRPHDAQTEPTFRRPKRAKLACRHDKQPPQEVQEFDGGWTEASTKTSDFLTPDPGTTAHLNETFGPHPSNHSQSYQKCVYFYEYNILQTNFWCNWGRFIIVGYTIHGFVWK